MYLLLCLMVVGAIISPGALFPNIAQYRPFFMIMVITLLSLMFSSYRKKIPEVMKSDQAHFIFGLLICEAIGFFITKGGYVSGTLEVLQSWLILFLMFLIPATVIDSHSRARSILWLIVLSACCVFWKGYEILKYHPELMSDDRLASYGMYDGANDFALILVLVFPIAYKLLFVERLFLKKMLLVLVLLIIPYLLVFTVSRGGMLGLGSGTDPINIFGR